MKNSRIPVKVYVGRPFAAELPSFSNRQRETVKGRQKTVENLYGGFRDIKLTASSLGLVSLCLCLMPLQNLRVVRLTSANLTRRQGFDVLIFIGRSIAFRPEQV